MNDYETKQSATKSASESSTTLSVLMGPNDANAMRIVHGGAIMRLVDEAGGLAAMRHAESSVVTAQLDSMTFLKRNMYFKYWDIDDE